LPVRHDLPRIGCSTKTKAAFEVIRYRIAVGFRAGILKTGTTDEAIYTPL
jgi:hypothetical protein